MRLRINAFVMLWGLCLGPLAEVGWAQTKKAALTCVDHTVGAMLGSDKYMACRSIAIAERKRIPRDASAVLTNGGSFVETVKCVEDLKKAAKVAADTTHACLLNDQRPAIAEALFAYHVTWEVLLSSMTNPTESSQIFEGQIEVFEKLALNRRLKYVSLMY